jgi:flagellar hook-associated protein 2
MKIEQLKVDRVQQQKTRLEWSRAARQTVEQKISDFRRTYMSVLSPETNMLSAGAYNTCTVRTQSASTSVSLTASETAVPGTVVVDRIDRLATSASVSSQAPVAAATVDRNAPLGSLNLTTPLEFDANGEVAFKINDVTFTFRSTDTLQTLFNTINASSANVLIRYSELTGTFTLASRTTGAASALTLENISGNALANDDQTPSAFGIAASRISAGQDASLSINGTALTRSSNFFTIDGLRYQLSEPVATSVCFTVARDIEPIVRKIQAFVSSYNDLVDFAQGKLSEKVNRDYAPLTDAQRQDMSEQEITLWEEKAKSGLLYNDRSLTGLLDTMRRALYTPVAGVGRSPADIGIRTGSYLDKGKISLDETALRNALTNNPEEVMQIFTKSSAAADAAVKNSESGFLNRLASAFSNYAATFDLTAYTRDLTAYNKQISTLNDKLTAQEDAYWKKFTAMETALSQMQSQSSWLAQQFS